MIFHILYRHKPKTTSWETEMTRESVAHGVYAPNAFSTAFDHTPFFTGWQYQSNGLKAIFSRVQHLYIASGLYKLIDSVLMLPYFVFLKKLKINFKKSYTNFSLETIILFEKCLNYYFFLNKLTSLLISWNEHHSLKGKTD